MATKSNKAVKTVTKVKKKRQYRKRQPKETSLPAPVEIQAAREAQSQPEAAGIMDSIGSLFSGADNPGQPQTPLANSLPRSGTNSLPPESERLLSAVPQTIGEAQGEPGAPVDVQADDPIAALMAQVAFEPQDVQDVLGELFDWMAERFESDHWKLTERQARMIGRPTAQLLNSMWSRLQNYLPDILSKWCEETPGATAFIMACGIVIVPKVSQQVKISRERAAKEKPLVRDVPPTPRPPAPAQHIPASGGIVFDERMVG
jgi:hypothetical protein